MHKLIYIYERNLVILFSYLTNIYRKFYLHVTLYLNALHLPAMRRYPHLIETIGRVSIIIKEQKNCYEIINKYFY